MKANTIADIKKWNEDKNVFYRASKEEFDAETETYCEVGILRDSVTSEMLLIGEKGWRHIFRHSSYVLDGKEYTDKAIDMFGEIGNYMERKVGAQPHYKGLCACKTYREALGYKGEEYKIYVFKGEHIDRLIEDDGELVRFVEAIAIVE